MNSASTAKAGRREWLGLAVLALSALMLSVDISVLFLALPQLSADLEPSITQQLWISDIHGFMLAGFLVTMGTLGDRIGRRRLLLVGAAGFGAASVLAAYAASPMMLIGARALLGIAGATLMPSTMALIRNMFHDPKQMGAALGVWFSCFMGGMAIGPLIGGLLLDTFWWGSAFLLGVPFMVLLLVVGPVLLPEYRDENAGRLDLTSVALSLAAVLPVIYGLKEMARAGVSGEALAGVVAGVVFGVEFVRRQRKLADPLLDLRLFANRSFSAALGVNLFGGIVMAGVSLVATLYLQVVRGLSPLHAGLWLVPQFVVMAACMMLAPVLTHRIRAAYVAAMGLTVSALGILVLTQVDTDSLGLLVVGLVIATGGIALPMSVGMNLVLASAPPEKAGSAASMLETCGEFGIAVGVAALGSLATFVYRSQLADNIPSGLPAASAHAARESINEAATAAADLHGSLGAALLDAARSAFTAGLNTVAAVGAALFAVAAVVALIALRQIAVPDADAGAVAGAVAEAGQS
jgi:MFS transporter, DHA2 family, multidrug resistance protein